MIAIKASDISALTEGGMRLAHILRELARMTKPGVSTQDLENKARELIAEGGDNAAFLHYKPSGAKRPYPAALCVSVNDCIVHGIPNENPYVIQNGDMVSLDMGLVHQGLITDSAITIIVGQKHAEDARLIEALELALDAGISAARVGARIGDIGEAIEAVSAEYGFGSPRELGGHSVGKRVHEEPFIPNFGPAGSGPEIAEGMVLAIEPMMMRGKSAIYLDKDGYSYKTKDGSRSGHVEHTILVTKEGPEILTK